MSWITNSRLASIMAMVENQNKKESTTKTCSSKKRNDTDIRIAQEKQREKRIKAQKQQAIPSPFNSVKERLEEIERIKQEKAQAPAQSSFSLTIKSSMHGNHVLTLTPNIKTRTYF